MSTPRRNSRTPHNRRVKVQEWRTEACITEKRARQELNDGHNKLQTKRCQMTYIMFLLARSCRLSVFGDEEPVPSTDEHIILFLDSVVVSSSFYRVNPGTLPRRVNVGCTVMGIRRIIIVGKKLSYSVSDFKIEGRQSRLFYGATFAS